MSAVTYTSSPDEPPPAETISFLPFLFLTIFLRVTSTRLYVNPQNSTINTQLSVDHSTRILLQIPKVWYLLLWGYTYIQQLLLRGGGYLSDVSNIIGFANPFCMHLLLFGYVEVSNLTIRLFCFCCFFYSQMTIGMCRCLQKVGFSTPTTPFQVYNSRVFATTFSLILCGGLKAYSDKIL